MPQAEALTSPAESEGLVASTIVRHDALDPDAEAFKVGDGGLQEGNGAVLPLGRHHFGESNARVVVDSHMDVFPSHASAVALPPAVAADAVTDLIEPAELFDVDVDHLTGLLTLIAAHRLSRLQCTELIEPAPSQD